MTKLVYIHIYIDKKNTLTTSFYGNKSLSEQLNHLATNKEIVYRLNRVKETNGTKKF